MRVISTYIHGFADYTVGALLLVVPWLFGVAGNNPATWVPVAIGASFILYSLMTDYELGLVDLLPVSTHLTLDFFAGAFLAASPWMYGFANQLFMPYLLVGFFSMAAA